MISLIILISVLSGIFYYLCIRPMSYWKNRGVKQGKSVWIVGDLYPLLLRTKNFFQWSTGLYNMFPGARYSGTYVFSEPQLIIRDPELIKQITIKDFEYFMDRKEFVPPKVEPLWSKNLVLLQGQEWKDMRNLLSPTYSNSKMKSLFHLMVECSENLVDYYTKINKKLTRVKIVEVATRFTNDVIAATAYGIKVDSLKDPNNEFVLQGKKVSQLGFYEILKFFSYQAMPNIFKVLNVRFLPPEAASFFTDVIQDTIKTREEKGIVRPDMLNILIEAKKKYEEKNTGSQITSQDIAAQAFIFFLGGFDTVSILLSTLAYELAANPDIQSKLRKEIEKTKTQCQGKLTYEAVMDMKYMDMVVSECLRKWPSMVFLQRKCTKPYTIQPVLPDETLLKVEKDTVLFIPVSGIHHDPKYWPNPDKFDPERFSEENKSNIQPYTYLSFGAGPRMCIGNRFTLMEVKTFISYLLLSFEIVKLPETVLKLTMTSGGPKPQDNTILGFKRIG